jgi:hypothetical protein
VAMVGALLVLVVMGAGALILFRTPLPTLASITPTQIAPEQPATVSLSGADFRPFLTMRIGPATAPLLVESPSTAEGMVPGLPPGTYDLVLFDNARELVRMADAITVAPLESDAVEVQVLGVFVDLTEQDGARVRKGAILEEELGRSEVGEVLAVRPSEVSTRRFRSSPYDGSTVTVLAPGLAQVPAIVRLSCVVSGDHCQINEVDLVRDELVPLVIPASDSASSSESSMEPALVVFRIEEIRQLAAAAEFDDIEAEFDDTEEVVWVETADAVVRARFAALPEAAALIKVGDVDFRVSRFDGGSGVEGTGETLRATILSIDSERETVIGMAEVSGARLPEPRVTFEATLRVPVIMSPRGWIYAREPVKVGVLFNFEGPAYSMDGRVRTVQFGRDVRSTLR